MMYKDCIEFLLVSESEKNYNLILFPYRYNVNKNSSVVRHELEKKLNTGMLNCIYMKNNVKMMGLIATGHLGDSGELKS